jgi:competence protein ComEC
LRSERALLTRDALALQAEMLIVPHHGSTTSSSSEFIAAVSPQLAVFTVGYRNRFGHPRAPVVERYRQFGARMLRSDWHGAITVDAAQAGLRIDWQRRAYRRYWQNSPAGDGVNLDEY